MKKINHETKDGGWTFVFADYYNENITRHLEHPRIGEIMELVNPYSTALHAPPCLTQLHWTNNFRNAKIKGGSNRSI